MRFRKEMAKKLSTNEKIQLAINGRSDGEDYIARLEKAEERARNSLRRRSLYGGGARAKIPRVKKVEKKGASYFSGEGTIRTDKQETSAVPPGAHSDQFRIVQYPTEKCLNDPDRVFYTTTSLTEGVRFMPQPAWYFGNQNKVVPSDSSMQMAANRYGYRGARNIVQYNTKPYYPPYRTKTPYTPAFLRTDDFTNEFTPKIVAGRFQTMTSLESPKLWPETTEFVNGYAGKKPSSNVMYNAQTTVVSGVRDIADNENEEMPQPTRSLQRVIERNKCEDEGLTNMVQLERTGKVKSATQFEREHIEGNWKERVNKTMNNTLKATLSAFVAPYEAHSLMDTTDRMRYSGSTALIVHSQSADETKFRYSLLQCCSSQPFALRWRSLKCHAQIIQGHLKMGDDYLTTIYDFGNALRKYCVVHGSPFVVERKDFVRILRGFKLYETTDASDLSLLFTCFDVMKRDKLRFVDILVPLAIFAFPQLPLMQRLSVLYRLYETFGNEIAPLEICFNVLCVCCASDEERKSIERYFKSEFIPLCCRLAALKEYPQESIEDLERIENSMILPTQPPPELAPITPNTGKRPKSGVPTPKSRGHLGNSSPFSVPGTPARGSATPVANGSDAGDEVSQMNEEVSSFIKSHHVDTSNKKALVSLALPHIVSDAKHDVAVPPTFHVCDSILNLHVFLKVISQCPYLLDNFHDQMHSRLGLVFGADAMRESQAFQEGESADERDFSWIIAARGGADKKKIEKPNIYVKNLVPQSNIVLRL